MLTKENILSEINSDILKKFDGDIAKCRLILFQFLRTKYSDKQNHGYVGYILFGSKNDKGKTQYTLNTSEVGTLNSAGILQEIKEIDYDDYFLETLKELYPQTLLEAIFKRIVEQNNISCQDKTIEQMFLTIKNQNIDLLKTYNDDNRTYRNKIYFPLRFFSLSEKYAPYEDILWQALNEEFSWRLNYSLSRKIL